MTGAPGAVCPCAAFGGSALCGVRPEAPPLDSAAFEKAGETFILHQAGAYEEG